MELAKTFAVENSLRPIFTGGKVWVNEEGTMLASTCNESVKVIEPNTSKLICSVEGDDEIVTTFAVKNDGSQIVTSSRSFRIKQWELPSGKEIKSWAVRQLF